MAENLATALAAFQANVPRIDKGKTAKVEAKEGKRSYEYSYADLADVVQAVLPALGKVGLSYTARPTLDDGRFVLAYALLHTSGEKVEGVYPLPPATTPAQQLGSAITYARRYCLLSITGVAPDDEDDDGRYAAPAVRYDPQRLAALEHAIDAAADEAELRAAFAAIGPAVDQGAIDPEDARRLSALVRQRKAELDAPVATEPAAALPEAAAVALPGTGEKPSKAQAGKMHALLNELGYDRTSRLDLVRRVTGRDAVQSSSELDAVDTDAVITWLVNRQKEVAGK